jgi:hypothetical protein
MAATSGGLPPLQLDRWFSGRKGWEKAREREKARNFGRFLLVLPKMPYFFGIVQLTFTSPASNLPSVVRVPLP